MNIAVFHNVPTGGARRVVYNHIRFLCARHHTVTLYTVQQHPEEEDFLDFKKLGCKIIVFNAPLREYKRIPLQRIIRDFQLFVTVPFQYNKMARDIENNNHDVIVVHPDRLTQASYLLRFLHIPHLYYCQELLRIAYETQFAFDMQKNGIHGVYERIFRRVLRYVDKTNAQSATKIITNSEYTANNIRTMYKRNADVVYPSVCSDIFHPMNVSGKSDIVFVGEPTAVNGYDMLEKSMLHLKKKPKINIISLRQTPIRDTELVKMYNATKVIVALSPHEPFGLVAIEAMACGKPVIAFRDGGYLETVEDGCSGYIVTNEEQLHSRLEVLLADKRLRQKMGTCGKRRVDHLFAYPVQELILEKIIQTYV